MPLRYAVVCVVVAAAFAPVARSQEASYSVSAKGNLTLSSRLFYNIGAPDEFLRNQYVALDGVFGVGIDVRRMIEDTWLQIGVSAEYLSKTDRYSRRLSSVLVPVEDGYWAVPIEVSGYFIIPFSSSTVHLYIGGGAGMYLGERRYSVAEERASIVNTKKGLGIHIVTGVEYVLGEWFALRSEIKFRDLQFESSHMFARSSVDYQGSTIQLPDQSPARSRVNVDGMVVDIGIVLLLR
jgi:hypothetical protein